MIGLTVHGIADDVMERLRGDAEATGQSVEDVALHILTHWHELLAGRDGLVERVRRVVDDCERIPKTMTPEKIAELERLKRNAESAREKYDAHQQSERDFPGTSSK